MRQHVFHAFWAVLHVLDAISDVSLVCISFTAAHGFTRTRRLAPYRRCWSSPSWVSCWMPICFPVASFTATSFPPPQLHSSPAFPGLNFLSNFSGFMPSPSQTRCVQEGYFSGSLPCRRARLAAMPTLHSFRLRRGLPHRKVDDICHAALFRQFCSYPTFLFATRSPSRPSRPCGGGGCSLSRQLFRVFRIVLSVDFHVARLA